MNAAGAPERTVVVADPRPVVAAGLAAALDGAPGLRVTAAVSTAGQLQAVLAAARPDVVLLPAGAPGALAACARAAAPAGTAVLEVGAPAGVPELVGRLTGSAEDVTVVQPRPEPEDELAGLTARELEVLALLAEGRSTPEIAAHLGVRVNTVRAHVSGVLRKLGVHSRLRAVAVFTDWSGTPAAR